MEPKLNTLNYAPAARRSRRRFRLGCVALLLVAAGIAGWHWRKPVSDRATLLYWQHRCMTYTAPADQVIFEEAESEFSRLLQSDNRYRLSERWWDYPAYVGFVPPEWEKVPYGRSNPGPAFLHDRRSSGGTERLVTVTLDRYLLGHGSSCVTLVAGAVVPASIAGSVPRPIGSRGGGLLIAKLTAESLRLYAGQADKTESSHFTIGLKLDNVPHTIDGTLRDDGTVILSPRDGRWVRVFFDTVSLSAEFPPLAWAPSVLSGP